MANASRSPATVTRPRSSAAALSVSSLGDGLRHADAAGAVGPHEGHRQERRVHGLPDDVGPRVVGVPHRPEEDLAGMEHDDQVGHLEQLLGLTRGVQCAVGLPGPAKNPRNPSPTHLTGTPSNLSTASVTA